MSATVRTVIKSSHQRKSWTHIQVHYMISNVNIRAGQVIVAELGNLYSYQSLLLKKISLLRMFKTDKMPKQLNITAFY